MSVINKMLRDLDARRGDARVPDLPQAVIPAAMDGTASVAAPTARRVLRWGLFLVFLLALAVLAWYLHATQPVTPPVVLVAPAPVVQPPDPLPEPVVSAVPVPEAGADVREPAAPPKTPVAAPREKRRSSEPAPVEARLPAVLPSRQRAPVEAAVPTPVPMPSPVALPAQSDSAGSVAAQRRQAAAQEALAQAQVLWSGGSREAALELVRETVVAIERTQAPDKDLLAQLVREQVRMELALGRPAAALAVLTRLESSLSGQADLWATRGNAAQRLGRHQEAVQAYLSALQLRPDEPRWMLGTAVSLAALGQLEAAARQAEQARALGPVSPEVWSYLKQVGVPLR